MKFAGSVVASLVAVLVLIGVASAQDGDKRVIIVYNGNPDPSVVTNNGGFALFTLETAKAIVAKVPVAKISSIKNNPKVTLVEEDAEAFALAQSTPWGISKIGADQVAYKGTGTRVAVVDTGIQSGHPDLKPVVLGLNATNPGKTAEDDNGHGTHVAGTIGARNNDVGVVGVAPEAVLVAVKVLNKQGSGFYSWIIAGLDWASDPTKGNAKVINLSLGGSSGSTALHDAIKRSVNNGVVVCAAAGNSNTTSPSYPAFYPETIAVAASDSNDNRAYFSNYGDWVDIAAPGLNIPSTWIKSTYKTISGTSMATPHVCGSAAALIASGLITDKNGDGKTNDEVRTRLESTAIFTADATLPNRVDLAAAVAAGVN